MMMMWMCKRPAQVPMLCVPIYNMKLAIMQKTHIFTTLSFQHIRRWPPTSAGKSRCLPVTVHLNLSDLGLLDVVRLLGCKTGEPKAIPETAFLSDLMRKNRLTDYNYGFGFFLPFLDICRCCCQLTQPQGRSFGKKLCSCWMTLGRGWWNPQQGIDLHNSTTESPGYPNGDGICYLSIPETHRHTHKQTNERTNKQTNNQTSKQTNKHTHSTRTSTNANKHKHTHKHVHRLFCIYIYIIFVL